MSLQASTLNVSKKNQTNINAVTNQVSNLVWTAMNQLSAELSSAFGLPGYINQGSEKLALDGAEPSTVS